MGVVRAALFVGALATSVGGALPASTAPTDAAVYNAAWTFILSAAAHASDAETDPDKMCRTALAALMKWLPDERARERISALAHSPVVHERLKFMPTMDDCAILLWYVHAADGVALGKPVLPPGLAPAAAFSADPTAEGQAAAAALWASPAREKVLAAIDRDWLGHAAPHPPVASARPSADLFVMSACPYGIASEKVLFKEVLPQLGDTIDVRVRHITFSRFAGANGTAVPAGYCASPKLLLGNSKHSAPLAADVDVPCSMHGSEEANEDARQMAVYDLHGGDKLRQYIVAFNGQGCAVAKYAACSAKAAKAAQLNFADISRTAAERLSEYAAQSKAVAEEVGYPAIRGTDLSSPTLVVNGHVAAAGSLDGPMYLERICAFYERDAMPDACTGGNGARSTSALGASAQQPGRPSSAVPAGASCIKADALPDLVPLPAVLAGARDERAPRGVTVPATVAGVLTTGAALVALLGASLRRRSGAPAANAGGARVSASVPLV
ncbi:hypothetical protein KFE25_003544 [Diacronema lutheri]|uniref:Thioredoxin-like fold domain-containing protein n=2 Tax=Diacronema lutheri TaxID=2081491 RepID=A0A8J6CAV4_DIALT|nr:hypothetical protein KFE25_003544 [Diacronema lutheri]